MKRLDENIAMTAHNKDFAGLPFYGTKGDFNFTSSRSPFTPGISVRQVPLTDLSVKGDSGFSKLDMDLGNIRMHFRPGDRVRGTLVNSLVGSDRGKTVIGKIVELKPNYSTGEIRCWIRNPKSLEKVEVYIDSIERVYESGSNKAMTFSQFINS